ncbi:hypothetical protein ElyMa_005100300 [Elysia marginata]|uniref:Uncharacterized protein n=1 Tax=Elysia marginata TaxID=1093978 RepID=A0AAV4JKN7_9GAST|nr:hypothetical protein ElyMa_005100300 [Elysia marginata]
MEVLDRQLCDFVGEGIFAGEIPKDVLGVLKTALMTNLVEERLFDELDFDMSKRRRPSLYHRSSINMWKHNRTETWVGKKKKQETNRLLTLARSC